MPERRRRLESTFQRLPIYFVTMCTFERRSLLNNDEIHARLRALGNEGADHGDWLGSYVPMPNHPHGFVVIDDSRLSLSTWAKSLKNALSRVLRNKGVMVPHWQKGFFDRVLRGGDSYSAKWEYVRNNSVRALLVDNWTDWPYLGDVFEVEFRDDRD